MKFDIDKHIDYMKSGIIYKPLIINGKKYAFDIDKYFDFLRLFARLNDLKKVNGGKNFYNALYYKLYKKTYKDKDYSIKKIKAYEERLVRGEGNNDEKCDEKCFEYLNLVQDAYTKLWMEKISDMIFGPDYEFDGELLKLLGDINEKYKQTFLIKEIHDDHPLYCEHDYIYSLVRQLIEQMERSRIYNNILDGKTYHNECYRNHLRMIEDNINYIFSGKDDKLVRDKWFEIIIPLQRIINECSFPGLDKDSIWLKYCEGLKYYDCAFYIANDFETYEKLLEVIEKQNKRNASEIKFNFCLGKDEIEFKKSIEARNKYFNSRTDDDVMNNLLEKNYMKDLLETLKIIVNNEFGLEVL